MPLPPSDPLVLWPQNRPFAKQCMRKPIPPVVRGFVTRACTVFGQFCTEGITFNGRSRPFGGGGGDHPDPEIRGVWSQKPFFFQLFGPQFGLKIRGAQAPSLRSATDMYLVPLHTQNAGFSLTTMRMTAGYFHRKGNENDTKRTLWLFSSPPAYCTNCKYAQTCHHWQHMTGNHFSA